METKLIELAGAQGNVLRGILSGGGISERVVLMLHGFERAASTEPKFKRLADSLGQAGVASFRLDFTGCGLSDGDFRQNTTSSYAEDARLVIAYLKENGLHSYAVVAHSLAACIVASLDPQDQRAFERVILLAPALNQKQLLRYWFVKNLMKKKDPLFRVTWGNYTDLLDEATFVTDCERTDKMSKANFVGVEYFLQNKERDFSEGIIPLLSRTLLVHGSGDDTVPLESLDINFPNQLIVKNGDHDLERPDLIKQWLPDAVKFLST